MSIEKSLKRTPLFESHLDSGGKVIDFAGWEMPVQYSGILSEVREVREGSGMFDVSHMGRLELSGQGAELLLNSVLSVDVSSINVGRAKYNVICDDKGGIIDDCIVYRQVDQYLLIPNASNRESVIDWLNAHICDSLEVEINDISTSTVMVAVQGPLSGAILAKHTSTDLTKLRPFSAVDTEVFGVEVFIARTGYTGEDGFEIIASSDYGPLIWKTLEDSGVIPCGLGARDVLRLEAGLLLHGNDMDRSVNPYEAGLDYFVNNNRSEYVARDSLASIREKGIERKIVGLAIEGRSVARHGCFIFHDGEKIGEISSGSPSPTLNQNIGMGYIPVNLSEPDTRLGVDIRGKMTQATVVELPFYKRVRS